MVRLLSDSKAASAMKAAFYRVCADVRRDPSKALIALVAGAAASFLFGIPVALVWTLFILFLVYGWNIIAPIAVGVLSLALCVVFVLVGKMASAEAAAAYAYFFLGIAAVLWFVRYGYKLI